MYILHLKHILVQSSHISGAQITVTPVLDSAVTELVSLIYKYFLQTHAHSNRSVDKRNEYELHKVHMAEKKAKLSHTHC